MNASPESRLRQAGKNLPLAVAAAADYALCARVGATLYVSGQTPRLDGAMRHPGIVGLDVTEAQAAEAAELCALRLLAAARDQLGTLNAIARVAKLNIFVRGAPGFTASAGVANAASAIMHTAFGNAGRHARTTVGVASLPTNACVEIDAIFEIILPPTEANP